VSIDRLLVANRGEIARRVFATAREMGMQTVAVAVRDELEAPFVAEADQVVILEGHSPAETYLNPAALLQAARRAGADAIHPGYGFLSEQASFAEAVVDAGLCWVGPPPAVMAAMGDKLAAKATMAKAGVPVLPVLEVDADRGGDLERMVFPVLVKAAAGGGGKGMRVVAKPAELPEALAAARREAASAFGDPRVFLERFVTGARHVEVQVLGDDHGQLVAFAERDCSVQRRHQKIIEESPSPAVDPALREQLTRAALLAAQAVDYRNAGTVEFLLEPSGAFWFLEMNTRLQVEHRVTEAVSGVDLVRQQLLVAQGQPLALTPEQLAPQGHAIEVRLYAEDPAAGFLPAGGELVEWAPAATPAVRWDSGVETGTVVGTQFDPLLAKVVAHAPTREEAARRLALALARTRIRGVTTNRDLLVATLGHPVFLAGEATTAFVEDAQVARSRAVSGEELRLAAIAAALAAQAQRRAAAKVLRSVPSGWRLAPLPPQLARYRGPDDQVLEVAYQAQRDGTFLIGDDRVVCRAPASGEGWVTLEIAGCLHRLHLVRRGRRVWVQGAAGDLALEQLPRLPERGGTPPVPGTLAAPMPGTVLQVAVTLGQCVAAGDLLVVVEAMKMEHRVLAPFAGTVLDLRVQPGAQVNAGDPLVVLEADEPDGPAPGGPDPG
jgi:propionyl-CoA carboxylase alpha chain